jgi:hypothetical protein
VAFFVWPEALGEILTLDNLSRHVILMDGCYMCKKSRESIDYLLLHYKVARDFIYIYRSSNRDIIKSVRCLYVHKKYT